MEYFDNTGPAVAKLLWSGPGIVETKAIAREYLSPPEEKEKPKPGAEEKSGQDPAPAKAQSPG
jgi:hypothetical protein